MRRQRRAGRDQQRDPEVLERIGAVGTRAVRVAVAAVLALVVVILRVLFVGVRAVGVNVSGFVAVVVVVIALLVLGLVHVLLCVDERRDDEPHQRHGGKECAAALGAVQEQADPTSSNDTHRPV